MTFATRVVGAALLNRATYEDVEADKSATVQAGLVVLLSSVAAGIGIVDSSGSRLVAMAVVSALAFGLWALWAVLTLQIGARIFPAPGTQADLGQTLRTLGFATAPGLLRVLGAVPGARGFVFGVTSIWMLVAMVVAVRQALDYRSTARAFAVCAVGWLIAVGLAVLIGMVFSRPVY